MPHSKHFDELLSNVKKEYSGKKVPKKYQHKYGKIYSEEEAKSIGFAIANKQRMKT